MLLFKKKFKFHARDQKWHFEKLKKCQNGNFEPMYEIWKKCPKAFIWSHLKMAVRKKYSKLVPGSAKSRIYAEKNRKRRFSKKNRLARIDFFFVVVWIPGSPGILNQKRAFFWPSKNLYRQCAKAYYTIIFTVLKWRSNIR